jgi:transaldolase/glucose-6-phosphate isomerase
MNRMKELLRYGQSVWLDYIHRSLFKSGELKKLIDEDGLRGMTSNPTIFEKAIAHGDIYDETIKAALADDPKVETGKICERLVIEDIRSAADILRPVYDETGGADGFVSIEVSPTLAHDTDGTMAEARRLKKEVNRPNIMIKVPATPAGIPAIEQLTSEGINVNITLMFSMGHYEAVARAYAQGLERAANPRAIASVASFFVSRVDTLIDKELEKIGTPEALALRGKIAIANSKAVYRRFEEIFHGEGFAKLKSRGGRVQRPLWASTGTKNPEYSDVLYVEHLIGPDTVNTLPPATIDAFRDHGEARGPSVKENLDEAYGALDRLAKLGVDLEAVGQKLQDDGVAAFVKSFDDLLAALEKKRAALASASSKGPSAALNRQEFRLGKYQSRVDRRIKSWQAENFAARLWQKDTTLWSAEKVPELADRLGWLDLPEKMRDQVRDIRAFADKVKADGFKHVVVLGMGGSSLAPEVFQRTFGNAAGYPELIVLDSTHPAAVRAVEGKIDPQRTLFLVSSKSGTTMEPNSFFYYFWRKVGESKGPPGENFAAITDPGTPLEKLAHQRKFRAVFQATPDVGGRYSALTAFGLVPAALIGVDIAAVLDAARRMAQATANGADNPALALGAALGELALAKRDKVTFIASPSLAAFPTWVEQLIAESTGKDKKGIVPVATEPPAAPEKYDGDRFFVYLRMDGDDKDLDAKVKALEHAGHPVARIDVGRKIDIGQEFFRWEAAVAAAGAAIGIHPFNQPDVQLAKDLAKEAMARKGGEKTAKPKDEVFVASAPALRQGISSWLGKKKERDYVSVQAYLNPSARNTEALTALSTALRDRMRLAATMGYGPRFLHSTGQLHKGGPNSILVLQLVDEPAEDLPVPETDYTFGALIRAQALGDFTALKQRKRRVLRINLGGDPEGGLKQVLDIVRA